MPATVAEILKSERADGGFAMLRNGRIDLTRVPQNPWDKRKYLLSEYVTRVLELSSRYVRETYEFRERLEESWWFAENGLTDTPRADLKLLGQMWFFPWREAQHELSVAIDQTLLGFHRASVDHQRRSLELILVGTWFVSQQTSSADARAWMTARDQTPWFSRTLDRLSKESLFSELQAATSWVEEVKKFYWRLSDISHVRGVPHGFTTVQPSHLTIGGWSTPEFSKEALENSIDSFISTVGYIALLVALSNPVLLFGFPVEQKFGINGPACGVFEDLQSEHFRALIPKRHLEVLIPIAEKDDFVQGMIEFFSSRPDLTIEELENQFKECEEFLGPKS